MYVAGLACLVAALFVLVAGCASTTTSPRVAMTAVARPPGPSSDAFDQTAPKDPAPSTGGEPAAAFLAAAELNRAGLVEAVLARNPSLAAAHAAWKAAHERPDQVKALDDPMVGYGIAPRSIGSSKVDFGQQADLSQRFPWPGKLRTRGEVAQHEAEARWHDYEAARLDLALAAVDLLDDYYVVARAQEINSEHVRLLEDFKRAAIAQYATGLLSQQDPLQAEVELAHLEHRDVELTTQRRVVRARLNALLHRAPDASLPPPPGTLALAATWAPGAELSEATAKHLEDSAVTTHPELAAAAAEVEAREADVRLASFEAYPDFGVTTSYNSMWGDEEHRWMVGFNMNLPIWRQRIAAIRSEARARLLEAEGRRRAVEDEVRSEVRQIFEALREAHHVLLLYRSRLLPAARDQVRAARAGVDTGMNDFPVLINAEKNLRDVELNNEEALAAVDRRLAELARAVGRLPEDSTDFLLEVANRDEAATRPGQQREGGSP